MSAGIQPVYVDYLKLLGEQYDIVAITRNGLLSWLVRQRMPSEAFKPVGSGWFRFKTRPDKHLLEVRAAFLPTHQGKGLYPRLLRAIRFAYARPLVSDVSLSEANVRAWSKVGVPTGPKSFRVNPKKPLSMPEQIALAWLATEGKVPRAYRSPSRSRR